MATGESTDASIRGPGLTAWLTDSEQAAWRAWLDMSDLLRGRVAHDLFSETGHSDADYAVMVVLSEAEGDQMRMTELASALRWTRSRLSHQFARMEERGLVRRRCCTFDARASYVELTPAGATALRRAAPFHVASVRRNFIDLLDERQLQDITEIATVVVTALSRSVDRCIEVAEAGEAGVVMPSSGML